jgi:hypothetical protein
MPDAGDDGGDGEVAIGTADFVPWGRVTWLMWIESPMSRAGEIDQHFFGIRPRRRLARAHGARR